VAVMPPRDKLRPWVMVRCGEEGCEFATEAEFAAFRHEGETGHRMDYTPWSGTGEPVRLEPLPREVFPWLR
jgi:hypothetical protein